MKIMTTSMKILLTISLLFFFSLPFYIGMKDEERNKKYHTIIYQDHHRYRTDKFDTTSNGIKFIDHHGKNVYISGKYIIERHEN